MATHPLNKAVTDVQDCIQYALDKKMFMPAVILIYSAVDGAAWLSHGREENTSADFIAWADKWIISQQKLSCTATELYAARCGVLHTFISQARLTRKGAARQICYVLESGTPQEMQGAIDPAVSKDYVSIHLNDLFESYLVGFSNFKLDVENDSSKKADFDKKMNSYYVQKDGYEADEFVRGNVILSTNQISS